MKYWIEIAFLSLIFQGCITKGDILATKPILAVEKCATMNMVVDDRRTRSYGLVKCKAAEKFQRCEMKANQKIYELKDQWNQRLMANSYTLVFGYLAYVVPGYLYHRHLSHKYEQRIERLQNNCRSI